MPDLASSANPAADDDVEKRTLPRLEKDRSFWGMVVTQFLGAFNDNLFKQLMLLLAVPIGAAAAQESDAQAFATILFSLPFVLFSGFAGFLSDRYSKRTVIVASKYAEIVCMALGLAGFLMFDRTGYLGLLVVLFLMGTQSAFFGPGKYGILPELFRSTDLPRANGIMVMTTFMAIIMGMVAAGALGSLANQGEGVRDPTRLWIGSTVCVLIALAGTATVHLVRPVKPANSQLRFTWDALAIPGETRAYLASDRPMVFAIMASSAFWFVSGIAVQAINSLGMVQLGLSEFITSLLAAAIAIGIAAGAVAAGRLSHGKADFRIVRFGSWGMFVCLLVMSFCWPNGRHVFGFWGSLPVLLLLGALAGFFAIPLQVFIQDRPPDDQKGRMIAVMNQANFLAMIFSGVVYGVLDQIVIAMAWPRAFLFAMMALLVLPIAIFYRPHPAAKPV